MADSKPMHAPGPMTVSSRLKTIYSVFIFVGLLVFALTVFKDKERAWSSYLIAYFFFLSLALGGLFFAAIQHATKAGWSVNVRRFCEALSSFLPVSAVLGLIFAVFGASHLYEWLHKDVVAGDHLLQWKAPYLNQTFYWIRVVGFYGLWLWFGHRIVGFSLAQDKTGDESLTHKAVPWSVIFLMVFALSYSLFSVDHMMSIDPHWFSTIFGVYCFAGLFQSTMAAMILMMIYFMKKGQLKGYVDDNHLHDMGKFMFAFTVFWAYIAFSQFMLIWYANQPEETIFFIPRMNHGWVYVSLALIIFKFVVPFLALLPKWAKRTPAHLAAVSVLVLIMQFVDIYWLIYPKLHEEAPVFGLTEVGTFIGFTGLFLMAVTRFLSRNSIVALRDPRAHESLHHHVVY